MGAVELQLSGPTARRPRDFRQSEGCVSLRRGAADYAPRFLL